ncbi:sigma-70 family RNA polymerase sigma factor [Paenibacillus sp. YPG26]|uniref:sigma-70 family RNA polymerase sigma factor n=1 Tax=Paenibacillus sp. YPG26 TaxID=2878915 RepID=UPI0020407359|nr:sigma-70 family RNA polymerase sigma factor [Paenibacillus sp. YPG26]USB33536.1 sigma-70 family RNA polymerase sigma factor [Paenibacillus sp. YPG26]
MNTISEDVLVEKIKNRDERAIASIIQAYGGLLSAIIRRYVHYNQQEYEECLDDVLLAAWHNIGSFDPEKNSFKQWIAAIAKYRAIDYQRKILRNQSQISHIEITDDLLRVEPVPPQRDVEEVLRHLSQLERDIFVKYYLEGVPSREMATEMKVQESWIHNKLSRGRKKLRQLFISNKEV